MKLNKKQVKLLKGLVKEALVDLDKFQRIELMSYSVEGEVVTGNGGFMTDFELTLRLTGLS